MHTQRPLGVQFKRLRGLTLIELMVVVAIIAILATIAYPLYSEQTQKSRRADGRAALLELASAQQRFYTANGRYAISPTSVNVDTSSERGYYAISTTGGATFTATATARNEQSGDADCTSMTITNAGVKSGAGADVDKCW